MMDRVSAMEAEFLVLKEKTMAVPIPNTTAIRMQPRKVTVVIPADVILLSTVVYPHNDFFVSFHHLLVALSVLGK